MITVEQLSTLTLETVRDILEELDWYYYGGSCYEGQSGKTSEKIVLNSSVNADNKEDFSRVIPYLQRLNP